ncbi:MAG TPA: hypothetical protein DDY90_07765 [Clostridiales bacterium]|nr:hypothetical protein [Clostridiales bacterium]
MEPVVIKACARGYSHIHSGQECQDSYKDKKLSDGALLLAVADGHGSKSCPYSKDGSEIAVDVFCETISELYAQRCDNRDELIHCLNQDGSVWLAQVIERRWKDRVYDKHCNESRDPIFNKDDKWERLSALYRMYGSTLLGMLIAPDFVFVFQLGDGDMVRVDDEGVHSLVEADKLLGVESDSLCSQYAWRKAVSNLYRREWDRGMPYLFQLSTDGFANSFVSDEAFHKTCMEYFELLKQYGAEAVRANLESWLSETSRLGCGDDTTAVIAYFSEEPPETPPDEEDLIDKTEEPVSGEEIPAQTVLVEQENEYESNGDLTEMPEGEQTLWSPSSDDGQWGMVQDMGFSD